LINNISFSLSFFVKDFGINFPARLVDNGGAWTGYPVGVDGVPPSWYDVSPGVGVFDDDNALVECWFKPYADAGDRSSLF